VIRARALALCASGVLASLAPAVGRAQESPTPDPSSRVVTLAQVERTAMTQQPQVLVARAQTNQAEAVADQARAPLLPQVTGTAQYTRQTGNYVARPGAIPGGGLTGATSPSLTTSYDYWSFGVSATQLVYDFGQQSSRYHAAETSADAQRLDEQVIRLQLIFGVRRAYFGARAANMVGVAQETYEEAPLQSSPPASRPPPLARRPARDAAHHPLLPSFFSGPTGLSRRRTCGSTSQLP